MIEEHTTLIVCILLGASFVASLFIMYVILFRLRSHLISIGYKFIFASKVGFAVMIGSAIYLVFWPPPYRSYVIQFLWFSILALSTLCSAIGFYLYSRDVKAVLDSDAYIDSLPANPANGANHNTTPPDKKGD